MSHLDELYEKNFQEKFQLFEQEWEEFRASHEHWTEQKIYKEMLLRLRKERNETVESKWKRGGDPYLSSSLSEYKTALFSWFQGRNNDYKVNPVHHFIEEAYPKLNGRFIIKFSIAPDNSEVTNLQLSEFFTSKEEVVKQLAHYEAILKFILKLEVEESDILRKQRYPRNSVLVDTNEKADLPFPDGIRGLISNGSTEKAAERLTEHLKIISSNFVNKAVSLQGRINSCKNQFNDGLIT
ncbi:MAG TPA: hypothetical protein PK228_12060 [Saprospiraceae bacterium]|nr:hypothetical protein [Saprospiraceae bacterium]